MKQNTIKDNLQLGRINGKGKYQTRTYGTDEERDDPPGKHSVQEGPVHAVLSLDEAHAHGRSHLAVRR